LWLPKVITLSDISSKTRYKTKPPIGFDYLLPQVFIKLGVGARGTQP